MFFEDRIDAGRQLAWALRKYADRPDVVVLGLPRGGVPVAYEVARALHAPLDIMVVRKLGVPGHEELAMGAVASGNVLVRNEQVINELEISEEVLNAVASDEISELDRRERVYRGSRPQPEIRGKTVIVVDDGIATGSTMRAAVSALNHLEPSQIVVATPVAARETCQSFHMQADELVCLTEPVSLYAVGAWYANFEPTSDQEVRTLLKKSSRFQRETTHR